MFYVFSAVLGACLGSFLNVVIYRLPRDQSIVHPRSSCPHCGAMIHGYDNIPIISYIILRGRCRNCKAPISARYPVIEAVAAGLAVLDYQLFGVSYEALINLVIALGMFSIAVIDFEHMIIPDKLSLGGIVVGLGLSFIPGGVRPLDAAIGAASGTAVLWIIRWVHMKISGIEGMGLGDVKLAGTIGAFVGWYGLPPVLFLSAASGLMIGGAIILLQRKDARTPIPFGVFLAVGTVVYAMAQPWWQSLAWKMAW